MSSIEYSEWFKFLKIRWFAETPRKIWTNPLVYAEDEISIIPGFGLPDGIFKLNMFTNQKLKSEE